MANNLASRRLTPEEMMEMETMGFTNASQYLTWKTGNMTEEQLDFVKDQKRRLLEESGISGLDKKGLEKKSLEVHPSSRSVDDAVLITQMKMELDTLRALKDKQNEGLGKLDEMVESRVNRLLEEKKQQQLNEDYLKLQLAFKDKETELRDAKDDLSALRSKISALEYAEKYTPVLVRGLAGITKGIANYKNTGLAGIFGELASLTQGGDQKQLSQEDEYCMDMGKNIQAMFTGEEIPHVMLTVAILGQKKELIAQLPVILEKMTQTHGAAEENKTSSTTEETNQNNNAKTNEEDLFK